MGYRKEDKTDKEIAEGFRELMQKRGILDAETYLVYLRSQKVQKWDASNARAVEAAREIDIIERMLEGQI